MTQAQAVIKTIEKLGDIATLNQINQSDNFGNNGKPIPLYIRLSK